VFFLPHFLSLFIPFFCRDIWDPFLIYGRLFWCRDADNRFFATALPGPFPGCYGGFSTFFFFFSFFQTYLGDFLIFSCILHLNYFPPHTGQCSLFLFEGKTRTRFALLFVFPRPVRSNVPFSAGPSFTFHPVLVAPPSTLFTCLALFFFFEFPFFYWLPRSTRVRSYSADTGLLNDALVRLSRFFTFF